MADTTSRYIENYAKLFRERFHAKNAELLERFILNAPVDHSLEILKPMDKFGGKALAAPQHARVVRYTKKELASYELPPLDFVPVDEKQAGKKQADKKEEQLPKASTATLMVVNQDDEYHTLVWDTTPDKIFAGLKKGVFSPDELESPLARLIAHYGQYHVKVVERLERGISSTKAQEKLFIVDVAQESIRHLMEIQEAINLYDPAISANQNWLNLDNKLKQYQDELRAMLAKISSASDPEYGAVSQSLREFYQQQFASNIRSIGDYRKKLDHKRTSLGSSPAAQEAAFKGLIRPFGSPIAGLCLGHFIDDQIENINILARRGNNRISGFFQRGDLFTSIVDAQITHRKVAESLDYWNPTPQEWNFRFDAQCDETGKVVFDFAQHKVAIHSGDELTRVQHLVAYTQAGGIGAYQRMRGAQSSSMLPTKMESWAGISWTNFSEQPFREIGYAVGRAIRSILYTSFLDLPYLVLIDLPCHIGSIFFNVEAGAYPSERISENKWLKDHKWLSRVLQPDLEMSEAALVVPAESHRTTHFKHRPFVARILPFVWHQAAKLFAEPFIAMKEFFTSTWPPQFWLEARWDAQYAKNPVADSKISALLEQKAHQAQLQNEFYETERKAFIAEFNAISQQSAAEEKGSDPFASDESPLVEEGDLETKHSETQLLVRDSDSGSTSTTHPLSSIYQDPVDSGYKSPVRHAAVSPYRMEYDEPNDALSGTADASVALTEFFLDNIYMKRPAAAMGFTLAACAGGFPLLIPSAFGFLAPLTSTVSIPAAYTLMGHTSGFMPAFSNALVEGKVVLLMMDAMARGPESILAKMIVGVTKDPVRTLVTGGLAVGFGYLIAFEVPIPWLSSEVAEDAEGPFPVPELLLAGAKSFAIIAGGVFDLSGEPSKAVNPKLVLQKCRAQLAAELTTAYIKYQRRHGRGELTESTLTLDDRSEIDKRLNQYLDWLKTSYKNPKVIKLLKEAKGLEQNLKVQGSTYVDDLQRKAQDFLVTARRRQMRAGIEALDPRSCTVEEKYTVMHWVETHYGEGSPDYVASVREKLFRPKKTSPLATSVRIALGYLPALARAIFGVLLARGNTAGVQELGRKISADLSLVAKAVYKLIKYMVIQAERVAASLVNLAFIGVMLPFAITEFGLRFIANFSIGLWNLVGNALGFKPTASPDLAPHYTYTVYKAGLSFVSTPVQGLIKGINRWLEWGVGKWRTSTKGKNLALATADLQAQETTAICHRQSTDHLEYQPADVFMQTSLRKESEVEIAEVKARKISVDQLSGEGDSSSEGTSLSQEFVISRHQESSSIISSSSVSSASGSLLDPVIARSEETKQFSLEESKELKINPQLHMIQQKMAEHFTYARRESGVDRASVADSENLDRKSLIGSNAQTLFSTNTLSVAQQKRRWAIKIQHAIHASSFDCTQVLDVMERAIIETSLTRTSRSQNPGNFEGQMEKTLKVVEEHLCNSEDTDQLSIDDRCRWLEKVEMLTALNKACLPAMITKAFRPIPPPQQLNVAKIANAMKICKSEEGDEDEYAQAYSEMLSSFSALTTAIWRAESSLHASSSAPWQEVTTLIDTIQASKLLSFSRFSQAKILLEKANAAREKLSTGSWLSDPLSKRQRILAQQMLAQEMCKIYERANTAFHKVCKRLPQCAQELQQQWAQCYHAPEASSAFTASTLEQAA